MADYCELCDEVMDYDCNGEPRCEICEGPCPSCYDGGMDEDECEDEYEEEAHIAAYDAERAADDLLAQQELADFDNVEC